MTEEELKTLPPEGDQPEVEIVAETPKPALANAADDEAAKRLRDQMKALEETAAAERQGRLEADRRAQQHAEEARRYHAVAMSAETGAIDAALESTTRQREIAERKHQAAMEAGDYASATKAQSEISEASAELVQLRREKANAEANATRQPVQEGRIEQHQQQDPAALREAFISSATPQTQTWLRQHRDLVLIDNNGRPYLDPRLMAAHTLAVQTERKSPDTPDYFATVEKYLNPGQQQAAHDDHETAPAPKQRQAPVAAPVSREAPMSNGQQPRQRIQLTKDQVEAAHMFGDPKKTPREREIDYWNNFKALETEGRIGQSRH